MVRAMNARVLLLLPLLFGTFSCIVPKESRILKRTTEDWRSSPVVLHGYRDTPYSGVFLTLRENGKFEHTSSGMLKGFSAGTWTVRSDTIDLNYVDNQKRVEALEKVIIDRKTMTLDFLNEKLPAQFRMRIVSIRL